MLDGRLLPLRQRLNVKVEACAILVESDTGALEFCWIRDALVEKGSLAGPISAWNTLSYLVELQVRSIHAAHRNLRDFEAILVVVIVEGILLITNINVVTVRIPGPRFVGHVNSRFRNFSFRPRRWFPTMGERTAPAALIALGRRYVRPSSIWHTSSLTYKGNRLGLRDHQTLQKDTVWVNSCAVRCVISWVRSRFGATFGTSYGRVDGWCRERNEHRFTNTFTSYPRPFSSSTVCISTTSAAASGLRIQKMSDSSNRYQC